MESISKDFYKKIAIESIGHCKDDYIIIGNLLRLLESRKDYCKHYLQNKERFNDENSYKLFIEFYDEHNRQILKILNIIL